MIGQQTEIKETGKIGMGTEMITVVCIYPQVGRYQTSSNSRGSKLEDMMDKLL